MSDTVIVGILSLLGTLAGAFGGVLTSNKLMKYRIDKLESKVNKHNNVIERTYKLEGRMNEAEHEIRDLKEYHKP